MQQILDMTKGLKDHSLPYFAFSPFTSEVDLLAAINTGSQLSGHS